MDFYCCVCTNSDKLLSCIILEELKPKDDCTYSISECGNQIKYVSNLGFLFYHHDGPNWII